MYRVHPSAQFLKALKTLKRSGRNQLVQSGREVVALLQHADEEPICSLLRAQWKDHALTGNMDGIRELHIGHDFLLLYAMDEQDGVLELLDLVTHEELRKWR